jgi:hypothetical protein
MNGGIRFVERAEKYTHQQVILEESPSSVVLNIYNCKMEKEYSSIS